MDAREKAVVDISLQIGRALTHHHGIVSEDADRHLWIQLPNGYHQQGVSTGDGQRATQGLEHAVHLAGAKVLGTHG